MTREHPPIPRGLMEEVVAYSEAHVHEGGAPFAAFVVDRSGAVVGRGVNRVRARHDPTAHAEVEALRAAGRARGAPSLGGMVLLASGEPCAMCYVSALTAGITEILYAVDREEAAAFGFDYRASYRMLSDDTAMWGGLSTAKLLIPERLRPFHLYRNGLAAPRGQDA